MKKTTEKLTCSYNVNPFNGANSVFTGTRGVLEVYMTGGGGVLTELHVANPEKNTSLKF